MGIANECKRHSTNNVTGHIVVFINNPEPDVPKGKPNGAMRSKFYHSKCLQFVVNNAACCVFHRYANRPIHR